MFYFYFLLSKSKNNLDCENRLSKAIKQQQEEERKRLLQQQKSENKFIKEKLDRVCYNDFGLLCCVFVQKNI